MSKLDEQSKAKIDSEKETTSKMILTLGTSEKSILSFGDVQNTFFFEFITRLRCECGQLLFVESHLVPLLFFSSLSRTINLFDRYVEWCANKIFEIKTLLMSQTSEIPFAYFSLLRLSRCCFFLLARKLLFACLTFTTRLSFFSVFCTLFIPQIYLSIEVRVPVPLLGCWCVRDSRFFFMFLLFHRFASSLIFVYKVNWIDQKAKNNFRRNKYHLFTFTSL